MTTDRDLDALWNLFCQVYPHVTGGGREALAIVLAEDRRIAARERGAFKRIPTAVLREVVDAVAAARGVTSKDVMRGGDRRPADSQARHEAWDILLTRGYSLRAIGAAFDVFFPTVSKAVKRYRARAGGVVASDLKLVRSA